MEKQEIITLIQSKLYTNEITTDDLRELIMDKDGMNDSSIISDNKNKNSSHNIANILYVIGALIIISGAVTFVVQSWNDMGYIARIAVTLGLSVVTYVSGLLTMNSARGMLSQIMFVISATLAPIGFFIVFDQQGIDFTSGLQAGVAIILASIFGYAFFVTRKNILIFLTIIFLTWTYFALISTVSDKNIYSMFDIYKWATLILGVSYMSFAFGLQKLKSQSPDEEGEERNLVIYTMYGFGAFGILLMGEFIGGFWDLIQILVLFGTFYISVFLKSRSVLILSALFLIIHMFKLTFEYFDNSLSWPLILILGGFVIIGVGYMTYRLNKKYISK